MALKNSVYVLPDSDSNLEDFQWLAAEIVEDGGEATVCVAELLFGATDADIAGELKVARKTNGDVVARPRGATWVTRSGVFVDRMASAWLIRRFIDRAAKFRFVAPASYRHRKGELRFDMYEGEFTHSGNRCTFETLLQRFSLDDAALATIAEVVHDIDLKDEKYGRAETAGIAAVLQGIASATDSDPQRIKRASQVFDGWYERLSAQR